MRKTWIVSIGFILFIMGILSMILKLCGMQFIFMRPFQNFFGSWSFLAYLIITLAGFMMVYIAFDTTRRVNQPGED